MAPPDRAPVVPDELLEVIGELSFARDLTSVTAIIRTAARRLTQADGVTFAVKDRDECAYVDEDAIAPLWKGRRFPLSACISGWVMQHRVPAAIVDVYADPRVPIDAYQSTFVKSLLMVPVRAGDPIAAIGAYWAEAHVATWEETSLLEALARAASLAMLNVQLWTDLQRSREASTTQAAELANLNRELQRRVSEFETLLDVLPVPIGIATDPRGDNIRTNRAFTEMLRLGPAENASLSAPEAERPKHFRMLKDGFEIPAHELPLQRAAREGANIRGLELEVAFDSGERRRLLEYAAPLFDEHGAVRGSVGAFIDVTEQRESSAALLVVERAAREEAERTNRIKDEFLASLSHELRTPLNAILGWTQLLRRRHDPPEFLAQGLDTLERNAKLQTQLIDDLLDMSRILSGSVRLEMQPVALAKVIEAAVESIKPSADAKGVRLETALDPEVSLVSGDPTRLQQVVWNLLTNALKFTDAGGSIDVMLIQNVHHVEVSVTDSGVGIAPGFLPHVFERFRQADASTTRKHGGLGIGLSIVKHLVELHGGNVRALSAGEGFGSKFSVSLPAIVRADVTTQSPLQSDGAPALPSDQSALSGLEVLVVDDDADSRELVELVLAQCGAKVRTAESAGEALALLERTPPDVIVSDIGLPKEDGYQFIRHVRALGEPLRSIPALALTAFVRSEDRHKALSAGFQMHVAKPVEPAALCAAVARLAQRS
jgi:signal transduction histidine kinase